MGNHIKTRAKACPDTKFVLGGHSQGGFVTVRTLVRLPEEIKGRILAVTMFGSPKCLPKYGVGTSCRSYCHKRDEVMYNHHFIEEHIFI
jgi:cutinase